MKWVYKISVSTTSKWNKGNTNVKRLVYIVHVSVGATGTRSDIHRFVIGKRYPSTRKTKPLEERTFWSSLNWMSIGPRSGIHISRLGNQGYWKREILSSLDRTSIGKTCSSIDQGRLLEERENILNYSIGPRSGRHVPWTVKEGY